MKRFTLAALLILSITRLGCGGDDSEDDFDRLHSRLDKLDDKIKKLQDDVQKIDRETPVTLVDIRSGEPVDDVGGLPPSGDPKGHIVRDGVDVTHQDVPVHGGGRIVFVTSRAGGFLTISSMEANGTNVRVVVEKDVQILHPALSPDGKRIAYTLWDNSRNLYVQGEMGAFKLTRSGLDPAWSHDSTKIAFIRGGNLAITSTVEPDAEVVKLTDDNGYESPTWSPTGRQIAFVHRLDGNHNIFVIGVERKNLIRITNNPADERHPDWHPDGDKIVYQSWRDGSFDIYVVDTTTFVESQLTDEPLDLIEPAYSPDGTKIVLCSHGEGEIYVMRADGAHLTNITNSETYETSPDW